MKYRDAVALRVLSDGHIVMEVDGPISCQTYFTALRICARRSKRGCETLIEMVDTDGRVERTNPWGDIQRDMEQSAAEVA